MSYVERAEALFERFIGYNIKLNTYTKVFRYGDQGAVIRNDNIVNILTVRAKASDWMYDSFFGKTDWVDINLSDTIITENNGYTYLTLPPTLFGTEYSEVEITYAAGYESLPADVIFAIREIASLLQDGTITEWNCILPVAVLDVIDKYRKEVID